MTTEPSNDSTKRGKRPSHIAYQVRDGADKGYWTRIGAAWLQSDGQGFTVQLDAVPLDGRIVVRVVTERNN